MNYCHELIEVNCSPADALSMLGDPSRLADWAIEFCQSVEQKPDGYLAQTVEGPRWIQSRVDQAKGVADILSGATPERLDDVLYIRVLPLRGGCSLVSFIYPPAGEVAPEVMELMKSGLRKEAEQTKKLLEQSLAC